MENNLEIERKFLIQMPDIKKLNTVRILNISQTYLSDGKNGSQRRVRKTVCGNKTFITYTEKNFLSPVVRREDERYISQNEYENLLKDAKDTAVVEKTRVEFKHKNQLFEMDVYPFSKEYAILELELKKPEQKIDFPECISVIKEVSDKIEYSNASLSNAGAFPET